MSDTREYPLTKRQADLVLRLVVAHSKVLGIRQKKPKGMTFAAVLEEIEDADAISMMLTEPTFDT